MELLNAFCIRFIKCNIVISQSKEQEMNISEAIRQRKSIRGFKPDPIPQNILKEILETAIQSPSALNTQPWEVTVITKKALNDLKEANSELLASGAKPKMVTVRYEGVCRQRQIDLAIQLFKALGFTREDKVRRAQWRERGSRFFEAPVAIIVSIEKYLEDTQAPYNIGIFCQSVCLAAMEHGLGTCIQDQGIMFPDKVREIIGLAQNKIPVLVIAIGYPDWSFPANKIETPREPIDSVVTWFGFDR
jgi:nitroreductase